MVRRKGSANAARTVSSRKSSTAGSGSGSGKSAGTLTVVFALYIAGLLGTLLIAGRLSDRHGRKRVLVPGLLAALAACLLFAGATSVAMLAAGRLLAGIAVGVIVSAGMAAVVDVGGDAHKALASLMASIAMVLGAGLGPLLAGGLAQWLAQPVVPIFESHRGSRRLFG